MLCLSVRDISTDQVCPEISISVFMKYLFSDSPFELVTFLRPINGAEQEMVKFGFSGRGDISNLTNFFFFTLNTSMCLA